MAEFGFFGVRVITWMHTPRRNGEFSKAGDLDLYLTLLRPLRTSWLIVGICVKNRGKLTVPCFGETEREIYQTHWGLQHLFEAKWTMPDADCRREPMFATTQFFKGQDYFN